MQRLKKIPGQFLDFITYSNLLIAAASFLFTIQTAITFNYSANAAAFFAATNFLSTFSLYNLQRIYQSTKSNANPRLAWHQNNKRLLFTLMFVLASLYYLIFKVNYQAFKMGLLCYIPAAIFSVFYFLPPFTLRRMPFFKIFFISMVWVVTSILIPMFYDGTVFSGFKHFEFKEYAYLLSQFCFIAAICIPFDIRDIRSDKKHQVKTIPVSFGLGFAKNTGLLLLLIYMVLAQNTPQLIANFITGVLGMVLMYYSTEHKHRFYFSVLVDGLILLQFALYLFLFAGY